MKFQNVVKWAHALAALCSFSAFLIGAKIGDPAWPWQFLTFSWILLSWDTYSALTELKSKKKD